MKPRLRTEWLATMDPAFRRLKTERFALGLVTVLVALVLLNILATTF